MNNKLYPPVITAFIFMFSLTASAQKFEIKITNIKPGKGEVKVALSNNEKDWLEKPAHALSFESDSETKTISFEVPYGTYAISIYQDINGNNELDTNFMGIPKEPIAFGNNYKPFGKPDFKSAAVDFKSGYQIPELKLYSIL
ncbi:DUF2141 domain-containing protein [Gramella sp. GC03-9]|uniref:DUF2141 domain-containing protein n=1 Tax=Christiangramia oceanisediminis TaxID=2920386 RepID=A0A9X2I0U6_9FLAO|nr:DUF2141 domain-containing protein [Gramella oceanisediminis]MCP9198575.1 DUF2141 domain-containing protein [Gramella oceanisediminis]